MYSNHYEVSQYGNCLEYLGNVQNIETDAKQGNTNKVYIRYPYSTYEMFALVLYLAEDCDYHTENN